MNIEEELRNLRLKEAKAEQEKDIHNWIIIKEKRLNLELRELKDLKGSDSKAKKFNPLKAKDINPLKMEVVGKNFIPLIKGGYNVIAGRGGVGKSAIALKSVLLWLQVNPNKKALAMFTEDAIEEIKKRAIIICNNSNIPKELIDNIYFIALDNDDRIKWAKKSRDEYVIEDTYITELEEFCKKEKVEYIILDPLKRFHSLSENSNDEMDVLVRDCFVRIASVTNSVLLVLHHSAKSGDGGGRGASTITDTARVSWRVSKFYTQDTLTKEIKLMDEKKHKIKLDIIKDNNGIERECIVREKHDNSIINPLHVEYSNQPIVTEFSNDNAFMGTIG